ncbi:hypothetical protein B5F41_10065 [Gordonibacter sp. An232A]|nr:hypothetical protein B5F41_10065 [Gordonibacter sp. An232A]
MYSGSVQPLSTVVLHIDFAFCPRKRAPDEQFCRPRRHFGPRHALARWRDLGFSLRNPHRARRSPKTVHQSQIFAAPEGKIHRAPRPPPKRPAEPAPPAPPPSALEHEKGRPKAAPRNANPPRSASRDGGPTRSSCRTPRRSRAAGPPARRTGRA